MCTCEPFKCKRFCINTEEHRKALYKIGEKEDCCIKFDCNGCAFKDNISEISSNLLVNPNNIEKIYYNIAKLFSLLHAYKGFVKKKLFKFFITWRRNLSLQLGTQLYIMEEAIIKILKEEKEYNDINYYNMMVVLE